MKLRVGLLFISVVVHALIFFALPVFRVAVPVRSTVELVEVPLSPSKKQTPALGKTTAKVQTPAKRVFTDVSKQHVASQSSAASKFAAKSQALNDSLSGDLAFAPSFKPTSNQAALSAPKFDSEGIPIDDPTAQWGSGGADFSRVRDLGKFDRLYDLIDANVMYPSVLAYHQIQGTVNARLILTPNGTCDWRHSTITSTQSHLRVYVLDVLNHVCARDLSRFARKTSDSNLDLSFEFAITEHNDEKLIAREKKVVGNVFLFYRNSQQSVAEWHLGPFRGMFPVPYVALDFSWLQENYDRVVHSRDPLREFKEHLSEPSS